MPELMERAASKSRDEIWHDFHEVVNMTPAEIDTRLGPPSAMSWGREQDQAGRRLIKLLGKRKAELDEDDYWYMRQVVEHVQRRRAQGKPGDDCEDSSWREQLMELGHDPLKA
jgi:hypothetical protein